MKCFKRILILLAALMTLAACGGGIANSVRPAAFND